MSLSRERRMEEGGTAQGLNTAWNTCGTLIRTTGKLNTRPHIMYLRKLSIKGYGMQPLYITYQSVYLIHYLLVSVSNCHSCQGLLRNIHIKNWTPLRSAWIINSYLKIRYPTLYLCNISNFHSE